MSHAEAPYPMKTRIFLRHGIWAPNLWAHLTGEEAQGVASEEVNELRNYTEGMLPEGKEQGRVMGPAIRGRWPVKAVFFSPYMRTRQTASLGFSGWGIQMEIAPELIERDRGVFAYQPSENLKAHPYYYTDQSGTSKRDVLGWRPTSLDPQNPCETLYEVGENRVRPLLSYTDDLAPDAPVVFVTSADVIIATRGLLAGFSSERLRQPLVSSPRDDCPGLMRADWIQNTQADVYYWGNPETGELVDPAGPPAYLASFSEYHKFDTGLMKL